MSAILKNYRRANGLTQHQLATRLDCSQPNIALIETRKRGIDAAKLLPWAETLGVTTDELLRDIYNNSPG